MSPLCSYGSDGGASTDVRAECCGGAAIAGHQWVRDREDGIVGWPLAFDCCRRFGGAITLISKNIGLVARTWWWDRKIVTLGMWFSR